MRSLAQRCAVALLWLGCSFAASAAPDTTRPTVAILAPADGSTVHGLVTIVIEASDDVGIRDLVLVIDDAPVANVAGESLTYEWDARPAALARDYEIKAVAVDAALNGNAVAILLHVPSAADVDVDPPELAIVQPEDGGPVSGLELVEVRASDDTRVSQLELRIDGVLVREEADTDRFGFAWDTASAGLGATPLVEARAVDATGKLTTASSRVSVVEEQLGSAGAPLAISPYSPAGFGDSGAAWSALSRASGARVLSWALSWNDAVLDPAGTAAAMDFLGIGGPVAIIFNIINATIEAEHPPPYQSFNDPGFAEDFSDFAAEFAAAHHPEYLFVGNEPNIYLRKRPSQVAAYDEITRLTREKVAVASPGTRVGVLLYQAFPSPSASEIALIRSLAEPVDFVGYNAYGFHGQGLDITYDDPPHGILALEDLPSLVPGKPFAVLETGWNTAPVFESNEALQATFLRLLRKHLARSPAEFVSLFVYQDGDSCESLVDRFANPDFMLSPEERATFAELLCHFGLWRSDGTPKPAWDYLAATEWPAPEPSSGSLGLAAWLCLAWRALRQARTEKFLPRTQRTGNSSVGA